MTPPHGLPDPSVHDPACAHLARPRRARAFAPPAPGPDPREGAVPPGAPLYAAPDPVVERICDEGADRLSTPDLLAVVLAPSARRGEFVPEGRAVLQALETLRRASCASVSEIRLATGIDALAAARLAAAFALGRRVGAERLPRGAPFTSSTDIFERYHPVLRDARKERFLCVMLDAKNRVMRDEAISEGSLTSSLVHPREVFAVAIRESAGGLVFVHNHPSGDPEPSQEDHDITRRLCSVGTLVGIRVMDHVVIGDGAFVSFLDRGLIAEWT